MKQQLYEMSKQIKRRDQSREKRDLQGRLSQKIQQIEISSLRANNRLKRRNDADQSWDLQNPHKNPLFALKSEPDETFRQNRKNYVVNNKAGISLKKKLNNPSEGISDMNLVSSIDCSTGEDHRNKNTTKGALPGIRHLFQAAARGGSVDLQNQYNEKGNILNEANDQDYFNKTSKNDREQRYGNQGSRNQMMHGSVSIRQSSGAFESGTALHDSQAQLPQESSVFDSQLHIKNHNFKNTHRFQNGLASVNRSQDFDSFNGSFMQTNFLPTQASAAALPSQINKTQVKSGRGHHANYSTGPSHMEVRIPMEQKFHNLEKSLTSQFKLSQSEIHHNKNNNSNALAKMRQSRIGPMVSRKHIQHKQEIEQVAIKTSLQAPGQPLQSDYASSVVGGGDQANESTGLITHYDSKETPNVLGVKGRTLDLLDDQRAEIERIVRKKARALKRLNLPASKPIEAQNFKPHESERQIALMRELSDDGDTSQISQTQGPFRQPSQQKPQSKGIREITRGLEITQKNNSAVQPAMFRGGGFFAPQRFANESTVSANQNPRIVSKQYPIVSRHRAAQVTGLSIPASRLPEINQSCPSPLKSSTIHLQAQLNTNQTPERREKKTKVAYMKPGDDYLDTSLKIQNSDRLSKAFAEVVTEEGYAAQAVAQDSRVRKERFHHFETDFALKLEKMNHILQLEVETRAADAESKMLGVPPKRQSKQASKNGSMEVKVQNLQHQSTVVVQRKNKVKGISSQPNDKIESRQSPHYVFYGQEWSEASQKSLHVGSGGNTLNPYKSDKSFHSKRTSFIRDMHQEDWLSLDMRSHQNDDQSEDSKIPSQFKNEYVAGMGIVTPMSGDYPQPRWLVQVTNPLAPISEEIYDETTNKGKRKELYNGSNLVSDSQLERIGVDYMPAIEQIQRKLLNLNEKQIKRPSDFGQISRVKALNADQSKLRQNIIQKFVGAVHNQSEFYGLAKHAYDPSLSYKQDQDPRMIFWKQCQGYGAVALPTLSKIKDKTLNLSNYTLNLGLCQGLGHAFALVPTCLLSLHLENNGITDESLAFILTGLEKQQEFKSLTCKMNQVDTKSIHIIKKLLMKPFPHNLDELRIINCQVRPQTMKALLAQVAESQIKRLALIKAGIDSSNFQFLIDLVSKSRNLIELDISWNNLSPDLLRSLFAVMSENRKLQSVNVSWNSIQTLKSTNTRIEIEKEIVAKKKDVKAKIKVQKQKLEELLQNQVPVEQEREKAKYDKQVEIEKDALTKLVTEKDKLKMEQRALTDEEEDIVKHLGMFIKYNVALQELNLSHTSLGPNLLREIAYTIRKSRSLLTLHLTGNTAGINPKNKKFLHKRLKCKPVPFELERFEKLQDYVGGLNNKIDKHSQKNEQIMNSMQIAGMRDVAKSSEAKKMTGMRTFQENEILVYQRVLGHKREVPGSQQWIELSTQKCPATQLTDWVSNRTILTFVFWSKDLARRQKQNPVYQQEEVNKIVRMLPEIDEESVRQRVSEIDNRQAVFPIFTNGKTIVPFVEEKRPPLLIGSLTDWQYRPMLKIQEFLAMLDPEFVDPFKQLQERGSFVDKVSSIQDLQQADFTTFIKAKLEQQQVYSTDWLQQILDYGTRGYENPCLINVSEFDEYPTQAYLEKIEQRSKDLFPLIDDQITTAQASPVKGQKQVILRSSIDLNKTLSQEEDMEQLWVGVTFTKPGKHTYLVNYLASEKEEKQNVFQTVATSESQSLQISFENDKQQEVFGSYRCLVPPRIEEIPAYPKALKQQSVNRFFKKETSVFRDWKEDNSDTVEKCFKYDQTLWKLPRFIKDEGDLANVEKVLRKNYIKIKRIFLSEASRSGFPTIKSLAYADYCTSCQILDQNLNLAGLDRQFTAATFQLVKHDTNPLDALQRHEFAEVLVRLAQDKYKEPKICATMADSLEKLLNEHILLLGDYPTEWQQFRDDQLWCLEVNDIYEANLDLLKKVYSKYLAPMKKFMNRKDCLDLLMKDSDLQMNEKDALFCFGMSKMTVIQENEQNSKYFELQFVEMLEMLGRVALQKFKGTSLAQEPLATKIEHVLDAIFPVILFQERKEVNIENQDFSMSDDDY